MRMAYLGEGSDSESDAGVTEIDFERCLDVLSAQTGGGCVVVTQGHKGSSKSLAASAGTPSVPSRGYRLSEILPCAVVPL